MTISGHSAQIKIISLNHLLLCFVIFKSEISLVRFACNNRLSSCEARRSRSKSLLVFFTSVNRDSNLETVSSVVSIRFDVAWDRAF